MTPEPSIADLLAAMAPEQRERCEHLIRELIRVVCPPPPALPRVRRARPRPVIALPADVGTEEIERVRGMLGGG